jgi:hypothetical protein
MSLFRLDASILPGTSINAELADMAYGSPSQCGDVA